MTITVSLAGVDTHIEPLPNAAGIRLQDGAGTVYVATTEPATLRRLLRELVDAARVVEAAHTPDKPRARVQSAAPAAETRATARERRASAFGAHLREGTR